MYISPITLFETERQITYENEILKAVQRVGFDVNKEELTKALVYDRGQYDKGYKDGYIEGIEKFTEWIKNEFKTEIQCLDEELTWIDDMAAQLKTEVE